MPSASALRALAVIKNTRVINGLAASHQTEGQTNFKIGVVCNALKTPGASLIRGMGKSFKILSAADDKNFAGGPAPW